MSKSSEFLPPGVRRTESGLVRTVPRTSSDGSSWEQERPVAETLEEAKEKRFDYYHPELGWMREGYKLERDRDTVSILADTTSGGLGTPSDLGTKESEEG